MKNGDLQPGIANVPGCDFEEGQMSRTGVGRNDPCPCKSKKKFKNCCLPKQRPHAPNEEERNRAFMGLRLAEFRKRFNREPGPNDQIFFRVPAIEELVKKLLASMKKAQVDPAFIYAFGKTGLIVVSENMDSLTGAEIQLWQEAIDEYRALQIKQ